MLEKAFAEELEKRNEEYIRMIKEFVESNKDEDWWREQMKEAEPPPIEETKVPWYYDKDGLHERGEKE